jgi:hypothetical protein
MTHLERRVNLSDTGAESFCLHCGVAYRVHADACSSCAAARPVPRREITDRLIQSAPESDPQALQVATLSALEQAVDQQRFAEVRLLLRQQGIPHLVVGEQGQPLDPDVQSAACLLVPTDLLHELVEALERGEWPAKEDAGERERPVPDDDSVELISCATSYEAEIVKGQLEAAGIPYQANRISSQFGLFVGGAGAGGIRVAGSDLERARQVIALAAAAAEESEVEPGDVPPAEHVPEAAAYDDDDRRARRDRRYKIARWLLHLTGVTYVAMAPLAFGASVVDALCNVVLGIALIALALWSVRQPTLAFALSFLGLALGLLVAVVFERPFLTVPGFMAVLAVYFAHKTASAEERREAAGQ